MAIIRKRERNRRLQELLIEEHFLMPLFRKYAEDVGIRKLRMKEMNEIIDRFQTEATLHDGFQDILKQVSGNSTEVKVNIGIIIALFSLIVSIVAIIKSA